MNKDNVYTELRRLFGLDAVDWVFGEIFKRDERIKDLEESRANWREKYKLLKSGSKDI